MKHAAKPAKNPLKTFGKSDVGKVRENNEDRFYFDAENGFFIVVDGMGGHNAGEKAAEIGCETIKKRLERLTGEIPERIREAITLANNEIFRQAQENEEFSGMACVLTAAIVENNFVTVGHIGDTRLYLLTEEKITKITKDHSPVGILEETFQISELEAMRHPNRNEVFRDVGSREHSPNDTNFIDIYEFEMSAESAILLCSDGLSDLLTSNQILTIYQQHKENLPNLIETLIHEANNSGGKDNITVLIASNGIEVSDTEQIFHETQEIVLNEEMISRPEKYFRPKSNILKTILYSRLAFFIYGFILAVLIIIFGNTLIQFVELSSLTKFWS